MDSTVKQILEAFEYSIKNYTASLGPDNPKLAEARGMFEGLRKKAEGGADIVAMSGDQNFTRIGTLLGELASEKPLDREELASYGDEIIDDSIPPASVPAAGYHMAYNGLPPDQREKQKNYYDRIFQIEKDSENAIFFNAALKEDGVLLDMSREPLIRIAEDTLEKSRKLFSPTIEFQQKTVVETYSRATTVAEIEFEGTRMAELSNVEHDWDALFIEVIGLLPACAIAIESWGPAKENVEKLKNSYRFMSEVMGITWDDVFANERYVHFFNNIAWPKVPAQKKAMYAVTTPEGFRDVLKTKFFDPFISDEPVPEKNPETKIRFWGHEYDTGDALRLLMDPPRPDISRD